MEHDNKRLRAKARVNALLLRDALSGLQRAMGAEYAAGQEASAALLDGDTVAGLNALGRLQAAREGVVFAGNLLHAAVRQTVVTEYALAQYCQWQAEKKAQEEEHGQ